MAKRWYIVHTYSGYENKVKGDLEHRVETYGMTRQIVDVQIPIEKVTELKEGGKPEVKDAKVFPGYVLVRMELTDDTWAVVRNTPGVTGFVGIGNTPSPLSREDYRRIMGKSANAASKDAEPSHRTATNLEVGQSIRVVSGPLADFDGQISEIMADSGKVRVMLTIFGRDTPVELSLDQIATVG